jgi:hypothetical protein
MIIVKGKTLTRKKDIMSTLKISKDLEERFGCLEPASDLIEDCKYILYFAPGWGCGDYPDVPVKSKAEAIQYLKNANRID